jgi:hypothetical protein
MAIYNGGILDEYKNKIGNVVGRRWRGLDVISKYQPNVKNPKTKKQVEARYRFLTVSKLARDFRWIVGMGFGGVTAGTKCPPRGAFMRENIGAIEFTYPDTIDVDYTMLKVAKGNHLTGTFGNPTSTDPLTVAATFSYDQSRLGTDMDDKVVLVGYNPADGTMCYSEFRASEGNLEMTVPMSWNGADVYIYGFVVGGSALTVINSPDDVSESSYLGRVTVA